MALYNTVCSVLGLVSFNFTRIKFKNNRKKIFTLNIKIINLTSGLCLGRLTMWATDIVFELFVRFNIFSEK